MIVDGSSTINTDELDQYRFIDESSMIIVESYANFLSFKISRNTVFQDWITKTNIRFGGFETITDQRKNSNLENPYRELDRYFCRTYRLFTDI